MTAMTATSKRRAPEWTVPSVPLLHAALRLLLFNTAASASPHLCRKNSTKLSAVECFPLPLRRCAPSTICTHDAVHSEPCTPPSFPLPSA
jgi:hypothetical protein